MNAHVTHIIVASVTNVRLMGTSEHIKLLNKIILNNDGKFIVSFL